jgi:tetratricopeptide (TPR) repeat protein
LSSIAWIGLSAVLLVSTATPGLAESDRGRSHTVTLKPADLAEPDTVAPLPEELTGIETSEVGVLKSWFERRRLLRQGDKEGAQHATLRILSLMEEGGIRGMENLAGALSFEGQQQIKQGDYLGAAATFELALRFDPLLPSAYFGLAQTHRLSGRGFAGFLRDMARGLRASASSFWWLYLKLANTSLRLLLAMAVLAVAFVVLMALRYQSAWRHDLYEMLASRGFSEGQARFLSAGLFLLPLLLWVAGPWILFYWLAGTFRYMRLSERGAAVVVLIFALLVTPMLGFVLGMYQMTANDTFRATVSATTGGYEPEKVKYIQRILRESPDNRTVRFLLASQLKDGGYFLQAFEHYKKLLDLQPDNYRAFNNMGNIYFATQQFGQGINYYRRATEVEPEFALAYFNTYLAQKEQFHFTEAEASLERARTLDPESVAEYLDRVDQEGSVTPLDAKIEMSEVWVELARESSHTTLLYPGSFVTTAGMLNPLSVGGLLAALAMGLLYWLQRGRPAENCQRCCRAYCRRCPGDPIPGRLCPQCAEAPETAHDAAAARYRVVIGAGRRLLGALLPGAAHLLAGNTLRGGIFLLAWCFLALHLVLGDVLLSFPGNTMPAAGNGSVLLVAVLMAVVWFLGNLVRFPKFR